MNGSIKYMLTAAGIALVSAVAGGTLVGWNMRQASPAAAQSAVQTVAPVRSASIFPQQTVPAFLSPASPLPSPTTNGVRRYAPSGNWLPSPAAFERAQQLPEVQRAREEFMQAQTRYLGTIRSAMEKPENAARIAASLPKGVPMVLSSPKQLLGTNKVQQANSGKQSVVSGQTPTVSSHGQQPSAASDRSSATKAFGVSPASGQAKP